MFVRKSKYEYLAARYEETDRAWADAETELGLNKERVTQLYKEIGELADKKWEAVQARKMVTKYRDAAAEYAGKLAEINKILTPTTAYTAHKTK